MSLVEDKPSKYDKRYQEYKRRIREIEDENEQMTLQLTKARHHIKRLRIERVILLEEIEELRQARRLKKTPFINNNNESDSELSISESVLSDAVIGKGRRGHTSSATPRKKRDPNAPKGPGNVFFLYCRMERDNIKDEVPNESLGEVTRLLGQKWKALTKEEKQKYYDLYKKEQEEYESAMKSYTAAGGGAEGAAAVEANKSKQDIKPEEMIEYEDEEVDMLQEDEEEEDEEEEDELENTHQESLVSHPTTTTTTTTDFV
ncbi:HMG-box [Rhizopus microsporus ATCC 52813]|uniref:HMG-box n=2 Tax=Rhizopus microsporus TaxID=58291 RepID=A0A2G4SNJ6_RHIZD|nr:HMG-box [Rhizopus microsporus ATCC 52813]PHZ10334.1 HMG-box [Rhizopus microsporus ATCC 52813]